MFFPKKDTPVYDDPLHVENDALFFGNTVVLLQNISRIWVGSIEKEKTPWLMILLFLGVSIVILNQGRGNVYMQLGGIGLFLFDALIFCSFFFQKQLYTLNIELNSSTTLRFLSHDRDFLGTAYKYLTDIFINGSSKDHIVINFKEYVVDKSKNTINVKDNTFTNSSVNANIEAKN